MPPRGAIRDMSGYVTILCASRDDTKLLGITPLTFAP